MTVVALDSFPLALLAVGTLAVLFAGVAWRKRSEPGALPLVVFNLAVGVGNITYALDILSTARSTQLLWVGVWLVAQAVTASVWPYVAIEYSGRTRWANPRTAALLLAEPVVFTVLLVVPRLRPLLFTVTAEGTSGSLFYQGVQEGQLFFVHFAYLFVAMLTGTFIFVGLFVRSRHLYRTQATAVAVAAVAPWTTVLVQSFGFSPESDPSAIAWAVSGIALTVGVSRFKRLDPVPAAHEEVVEKMGDGVLVLDEDDIVSTLNPAARDLLADADPVGRRVGDVFEEWAAIEYGDAPTDWQEVSLSVDGQRRFLEVQVSPFRDRFDRLVGRLVVMRDVTERTTRERALARYEAVFRATDQAVYVLDEDGRFTMGNDALAALLGIESADELVGEPFGSVLADGAESTDPPDPGDGPVEVTVERADGTQLPCETRLSRVSFAGGTAGAVGFVRDISRRKAVERDLAVTTERFETQVEASPVATVATDTEGRVEVWNGAAEETFGWTASEVVGEPMPAVPDGCCDRLRERFEAVLGGETVSDTARFVRADGSELYASYSVAPVADESGAVDGIVAVIEDITERRRQREELQRQKDRLEEFAGVVSHDLRNPLQVASGGVDLARDTGEFSHLDRASRALDRMERLIDEVLALAREGESVGETEAVALGAVLDRAWSTAADGDATLETGDLPSVVADGTRLQELFANLVRNAVDHGTTEDGDGVTVTVGTTPDGFYVADDGPGIPEDERDDVFDAAYTTTRDGTGFGLAIVRQIANGHGWSVTVAESDEGGARFEFSGVEFADETHPVSED